MAAPTDRRKRALIIVNSNYQSSVNRFAADDQIGGELSDALQQIGFQVTTACDLDKHEMTLRFIRFAQAVEDGDLALVYFSGHACEVKGLNYLIPVDDEWIRTERDVEDFSVNFNQMLRRFERKDSSSSVHVFILDCPRSYTGGESDEQMQSEGLAEIDPIDGSFIQLACAAKATTRENLFAKHLLKNITRENIPITDLFREIVDDVKKESNGEQQPLSINGLKRNEDIYLNHVPPPPSPPPPIPSPGPAPKPDVDDAFIKEQADLKAHYGSFPRFEDVFGADNDDIRKAEEFTRELLAKTPSGDVNDKQTVFHAIHQMFADEGEECLFFDSSKGVRLYNTFGNLADRSLESKPFVLELDNLDEFFSDGEDKSDELAAIKMLNDVIRQNGSHAVTDAIIERIAEAFETDKENIVLKCIYQGSKIVVFAKMEPKFEGHKSKSRLIIDKKQPEKLRERFKSFKALKIHPLLRRPTFDVSDFDKRGNKDFTAGGATFSVGPPGRKKSYTQPAGFVRYGWSVLGRYTSDTWLDPFGDDNNWYRAFHGTRRATAADFDSSSAPVDADKAALAATVSIYRTGFRPARVAKYGSGVYCSPNPVFIDLNYAGSPTIDTAQGKKTYKIMLQVAVNPDGVECTEDPDIWVVEQPPNIRTYGLLIKESTSPSTSTFVEESIH